MCPSWQENFQSDGIPGSGFVGDEIGYGYGFELLLPSAGPQPWPASPAQGLGYVFGSQPEI